MDPGTGKTKAAIDAAFMLALKREVKRVVVCCPISALAVWQDELKRNAPVSHDMDWRIINYDKLSMRQRNNGHWFYKHVARIERFNPDLIILDESHRCKRASANRSQALWRLVTRLRRRDSAAKPYVWLLTGTPNPKGYIDLFAQFRIMDPSVFGTSKAGFEKEYCEYGYGPRRFTIERYRNLPALLAKIREHSVTAPEPKLPPQLFQIVRTPLSRTAEEAYEKMAEEFLVELEDGTVMDAANVAVRRLRLRQITGGFTTDRARIHGDRLAVAKDLLFDLHEQGQNVVVYAHFLAEVTALAEACEAVGYHTEAISGATPPGDRREAVRRFQSARRPMALVFQVATGSLAITLTAASEVLFYSLPDGWDTWYQATKRTHRIGQNRRVRYRILLAPDTVDVSTLYALAHKASMHHELMQTPNRFLRGAYDLADLQTELNASNKGDKQN
jgi:SNF2 family DNA or RNA helicase